MTDNEIIKALECCGRESCLGCPYRGKCHQGIHPMIRDALDLVTRQQAEIEKIKTKLKYYLETNEENGVVYIPKFIIDNLVKEMEGKNNA